MYCSLVSRSRDILFYYVLISYMYLQLEACKIKLEAVQVQLKEERDKYKSVIYDVIEDKQPGLYKEGSGGFGISSIYLFYSSDSARK